MGLGEAEQDNMAHEVAQKAILSTSFVLVVLDSTHWFSSFPSRFFVDRSDQLPWSNHNMQSSYSLGISGLFMIK